tara:strand:+ start:122 stop:460 length:339 start_codon:yes stop_codon:yes gene_type:complete
MFEIGFPEVIVIAAITLIVVGPEKIPQLITTISLFIKRLRLYFENIKQEIEKEINADEIRAQIHNQSIMGALDETQNKIAEAAQDVSNLESDFQSSLESKPKKTKKKDDIAK